MKPCRICVPTLASFWPNYFLQMGPVPYATWTCAQNEKARNYRAFKMVSQPLRCPAPKGSYLGIVESIIEALTCPHPKSKSPSGAVLFGSLHVTGLGIYAPTKWISPVQSYAMLNSRPELPQTGRPIITNMFLSLRQLTSSRVVERTLQNLTS